MASLERYLDERLAKGRAYFSKDEALKALRQSPVTFSAAATRLIKKQRLALPHRGFYLILRPEDAVIGAPDPVRWIDPLMKFLGVDYRISLLRAAAHHGSSHQAAMVFQVITPKQLRTIEMGRHRVLFTYQAQSAFEAVNQPAWLGQIKSEAGFAKVAGIELTLLDAARYFHQAGGINSVAQIVSDLGAMADPRKLRRAATEYENSSVRRLGYLLDCFGAERQAAGLERLAKSAKSLKPLDPSVKPVFKTSDFEKNKKWMLEINEAVEIDS